MLALTGCNTNTDTDTKPDDSTTDTDGDDTTTVNYGTVEAPLSVETFLTEVAKLNLEKNAFSDKQFFVKGKITTVSTYYYDLEGGVRVNNSKLDTDVDEPYQNDTIIVEGYAKCSTSADGSQKYFNLAKKDSESPTVKATVRGNSAIITSPETLEHVTVDGLNNEYTNGETATFTITLDDGDKYAIDKVYANTEVLTAEEGSSPAEYSFVVKGDTTVTISIKDTSVPAVEKTYDFSKITASNTSYTAETAKEAFDSSVGTNPSATVENITNVTKVYPDAGRIKFGSSNANGSIILSLNKNVSKVILNIRDYKTGDSTTNSTSINDVAIKNPINSAGDPEDVEFNLSSASNTIKIECTGRAYIYYISFVAA